jgi:carbon-monoxide dehydrogenase large subunit
VRWVGRPLPRYEDPVLLQGRGRYTADLAQGARILRFVRSPVARGRILAVNAPPEVPIVTVAVLGDVKPICPRLDRPDYVAVAQPILARDRVTYVGEPIAAVIADTAAEAEDLAEQVTVEIEAETPVVTLDQALAPGAPLVHDMAAENTLIDARFETSDVAAAFAAAHQVVEFTFTSGRQAAAPLEARGAVAAFDPATGRVTLSASTQMPHLLRTGIADALGIPESELRVIAPEVGGGFGQKMALIPEYVVAVWAARHFACTVAWIEDRLENLTASFHARDQRLHLRGAFDADGRLLAIDTDVLCNVGAYSNFPATCGVEPLMALADMPGPYQVPEYRARARGVARLEGALAARRDFRDREQQPRDDASQTHHDEAPQRRAASIECLSERKPGNSVSLPGTQAGATLGCLLRLGTAHRIGDPQPAPASANNRACRERARRNAPAAGQSRSPLPSRGISRQAVA